MTWGTILTINVGRPAQKPRIPSLVAVLIAQSTRLLYGIVPSGFLVIFYSFVFTLSKGKLIVEAIAPEIKLDKTHIVLGLSIYFYNLSFDSSYDTNIPRFNDIALTTVGVAPFQRLVNPSSFDILFNASKKCL